MKPLALLALALVSAPACADLTHFYCYAPDPASGTVYVSNALPVGPVAERGRYGVEFVEHLKKTGRVRGDATAYCVMRDGERSLAQARQALPLEQPAELGGLTRFADVAWSRNGVALPTAPIVPAIHSELHAPPAPERAPPQSRVTHVDDVGPWVVVLGNTETGKLLVVSGHPDLEKTAHAQATTLRTTGWTDLVSTRTPGYGAAMCVQVNEETRFFVAEGKSNVRDAFRAAREQAEPLAQRLNAQIRPCGTPWHAQAPASGPREEPGMIDGAIDAVKGKVRDLVTCDPKAKNADGTPACKSTPVKADAVGTRG